jgi:hypothetical protein
VKQGTGIQSIVVHSEAIKDKNKIAGVFNKCFLSVADFVTLGINGHTSTTDPVANLAGVFNVPCTKMSWCYPTAHETGKIIKSLNTKDSLGYDEITNRIFKLSEPFIILPLTYICNMVLGTVVFPDRLKFATVTPCFKKDDVQEISNYRSISLLTSFSEFIEKLIYSRLITDIEANSILAQEQYGFSTHCSAEMAVFSLISSILIATIRRTVGGIFCKLDFYGIERYIQNTTEILLNWQAAKTYFGLFI